MASLFFSIQIILVLLIIVLVLMQSDESDIISGFSFGDKNKSFGSSVKLKPITKFTWLVAMLFICNTAILTAIYSTGKKSYFSDNYDDFVEEVSNSVEVPINDD